MDRKSQEQQTMIELLEQQLNCLRSIDRHLERQIERLESLVQEKAALSSNRLVEVEGYINVAISSPSSNQALDIITELNTDGIIYKTKKAAAESSNSIYNFIQKIKIRCDVESVNE